VVLGLRWLTCAHPSKFREFGSGTVLSLLEATNTGIKMVDEDGSKGQLFSALYIHYQCVCDVELTATKLSILLTHSTHHVNQIEL
jgi:hypothetical protein